MRKKVATGLLILTLASGVASANGAWTPCHKLSVNQTSFAQQVRTFWNHIFAWL